MAQCIESEVPSNWIGYAIIVMAAQVAAMIAAPLKIVLMMPAQARQ